MEIGLAVVAASPTTDTPVAVAIVSNTATLLVRQAHRAPLVIFLSMGVLPV
jgi:hypothetical protein